MPVEHFIITFPDDPDKPFVAGFHYLPKVEELANSDPSKYTKTELLDEFNRKPAEVWVPSSITAAQVSLIVVWILLWLLPGCFLAAMLTSK